MERAGGNLAKAVKLKTVNVNPWTNDGVKRTVRIVEIKAQIKGEFHSLGCSSARFQWGEKLFFGRERRDRKQNTIVPSRMMVLHNTQVKVSQSRANSLFLWSCFSRLSYGWKLSVWNPTGYFKNTFQTWLFQQRPRIMPNSPILKEI